MSKGEVWINTVCALIEHLGSSNTRVLSRRAPQLRTVRMFEYGWNVLIYEVMPYSLGPGHCRTSIRLNPTLGMHRPKTSMTIT